MTLLVNTIYEELNAAVIVIHEQIKPELFARLIGDTKMKGRPSYFQQEFMTTASKIDVREDLVRHKFIQPCRVQFSL